jgi:hypothetical protein
MDEFIGIVSNLFSDLSDDIDMKQTLFYPDFYLSVCAIHGYLNVGVWGVSGRFYLPSTPQKNFPRPGAGRWGSSNCGLSENHRV